MVQSPTCSTPEGIDAAITWIRDQLLGITTQCSTPEGIDAAITLRIWNRNARALSAQRPKASLRRSPVGGLGNINQRH